MIKDKNVTHLMNENGTWKESSIASDSETILDISLRNIGSDDEIIWGVDKNGMFQVKSVYHLRMKSTYANDIEL